MEELIKDLQSFDPGVPDPSEFMDCKWHPPKGHMEGFVFTDEIRRKMSVAAKKREPNFLGKTHTKEVRNKLSELYKGKPFIGEHNSHKGTKWWNDGQINRRSVECPGKDFVPGRIPLGSYKRR
tara:strand:- start:74 stop:442 length:369 start_codon:yes stop_codon:yes gene_type:complete